MTPIKIIGILGAGGLRMDFVAGWLGKHPEFVESYWSINPKTRQSDGVTMNCIDLSDAKSYNALTGFLESRNNILSPDAELKYATKLHKLDPYYIPLVNNGSIEIYEIAPNDADLFHAKWEYAVKTFGKLEYEKSYTIDQQINKNTISNADRIDCFDRLLRNTKNLRKGGSPNTFPKLEFSKLFTAGGSKYLCEILKLDADEYLHDYWNFMLPLARTPDTIELWGKVWRKQDYF